jgi:hypothetical protein
MEQPKTCLQCGKVIRGRADKKFCDDYCRNIHNNHLKAQSNNYMRNVNHALGKNRRILQGLIPSGEEMVRTTKEKLLNRGFLFRYITHLYTSRNGNTYYYCYDHGYLPLDNDRYLIVRRREEGI